MKKKLLPVFCVMAILALIIGIISISVFIRKYSFSKERQDLNEYYNISAEDQVAIILNHELLETHAKLENDSIYLNYQLVHDRINPRFYWDSNENILLYATERDLYSVNADKTSYQVNKANTEYGKTIVRPTSDSAYIELDFVTMFSAMTYEYYENPNRLVITSTWGETTFASIKKDTQLRTKGGIKSPILTDVKKGDTITVLETEEKWTKVATADGFVGYVTAKSLGNTTTETLESGFPEETFSHIEKPGKICMAWHQVTNQTANRELANILAQTKGINVISPTWFYLNDNSGNIADLASTDYVTYCHNHNIEVWGLVSNLENSNADSTYVLTHTSTRQNLVNQIVANAIKYELDGVNLDFEALNGKEVGDAYIQFVRELSIKCGNNGLVLSIDNYVPMPYTSFYNRSEQAKFADYVVIMGYDEHYAGSEEGSVSSIGWVKEGVENTLKEVPASQVILGMPFYTRLWELTPPATEENADVTDTDPTYDVISTVYSMKNLNTLLTNFEATPQWLEDCGQNYAEWENENKIYKIWLEDSASAEARLKVMKENNLAGASFWKLGFESPEIWDTIIKYMN